MEACAVCGALSRDCCSRCERVFYCSVECQREDWPKHKLSCSRLGAAATVRRAVPPPPPSERHTQRADTAVQVGRSDPPARAVAPRPTWLRAAKPLREEMIAASEAGRAQDALDLALASWERGKDLLGDGGHGDLCVELLVIVSSYQELNKVAAQDTGDGSQEGSTGRAGDRRLL